MSSSSDEGIVKKSIFDDILTDDDFSCTPIPPSEQMLLTQPANKDHATSSLSDFSTSSDDSFIDSDHYKSILKSSKKVKKRLNNLNRFKKGRKKMKTTKQPKKRYLH